MKKNRLLKVLTSAALTAVMVASMGTSAFAAVSSIDLTKTVTTDGDTYAPNTAFTFTIAEGTANGTTTIDGDSFVVSDGVDGGLTFDGGMKAKTITFAPSGDTTSDSYTNAEEVKLSVDITKFSAPGVYYYTVSESDGQYEGITYDTTARDVYLYVVNGNNGLEVDAIIVAINGEKQKDGLAFTNDYGKITDPDDPDNPDGSTHDLTVTKSVTGNQGDKNKAFEFNVNVDGAEGEWYKVIVTDQNGATQESHLVSGTSIKYYLKDSESIQILGLTASDTYTITEENYTSDGYTTTEGNKSGNVTADGTNYTVVNEKNVSSPTGIVLSFAPYILLVALAGVFGVSFLRKKREDF